MVDRQTYRRQILVVVVGGGGGITLCTPTDL